MKTYRQLTVWGLGLSLVVMSSLLSRAALAPVVTEVRFVDSETGQAVRPDSLIGQLGTLSEPALSTQRLSVGDDGRLLLAQAAGVQSLSVVAKGYREMTVPLVGAESGGNIYNVVLDPAVPSPELQASYIDTLRQPDAAVILGYVADNSTHLPLAGVRVSCFPAGNSTLTDERGYFMLHVPLPTNGIPASLSFEHDGYKTHLRENLELWPYGDWIYRISLQPGVGGEVVDELETRRNTIYTPEYLRKLDLNNFPEPNVGVTKEVQSKAAPASPSPEPTPSVTVPDTIRVLRTDGIIDTVSLQTYSKRVLASEWIPSWGSYDGGMNCLMAGAVCVRTYGAGYVYNPISGSYDICATTTCQVYNPSANSSLCNTAVDDTDGKVMVPPGSTTIPFKVTEFSAENNSLGYSCGDCYTQPSGGCLSDPVCCGESRFGHGRGLCQWGSARWATGYNFGGRNMSDHSSNGYAKQDWVWILNHYYPSLSLQGGAVSYGGIVYSIEPPAACADGARWRVDGGAWMENGQGVGWLSEGFHTVDLLTISGWVTPDPVVLWVNADANSFHTSTYVGLGGIVGSLEPPAACTAGARWRVDSSGWMENGTGMDLLTEGSHTVSFLDVAGWVTPATTSVWVNQGANTFITGTYVGNGAIVGTIEPAAARTNGARWRVDGGTWQVSGAVVTNLGAGTHAVSYLDVAGWTTPSNASVSVTAGSTSSISRTYVRQVGNLQVTLGPADAPAAGARWRRVGTTTWQTSGFTETNLLTGSYAVEFLALGSPWYSSPGNVTVTVSNNVTTTASARYNRPPLVTEPGDHFAHVGAAVDFSVSASDPDGDGVTFWITNAPGGSTFSQNGASGTFHFVASSAQAGQLLSATFLARESYQGLSASKVAMIQIGGVPIISGPSNTTVVVSNTVSIMVNAPDSDNDPKTFVMTGAPEGATLTGTGDARLFSYTAQRRDAGKTFNIDFMATDVDGSGSGSMSLRVKSPPVFGPLGSQRVRAGSLLVLMIEARDPDGDAMSFLASGAPASADFVTNVSGGVFTYSPAEGEIGQVYNVQFQANDVDGVQTMAVPITVIGPTDSLTLFDPFYWWAIDGFGGRLASSAYRAETAGAQGQPVGPNASELYGHSAGFILAEDFTWYDIVATATSGGSIAPSGTVQVVRGGQQPFSIVPQEYYYISDVEVDGASVGATNAYLFESVSSNRSIRALFAAHRTTQGVPWWWLASYGLTNQAWEEAAATDQGGGMLAWQAWIAGTDPTDPSTTFQVIATGHPGELGQVILRTVPGRRYVFKTASSISAPSWQLAEYSLSPTGSPTNVPLAASSSETIIYLPMDPASPTLFVQPQVLAP